MGSSSVQALDLDPDEDEVEDMLLRLASTKRGDKLLGLKAAKEILPLLPIEEMELHLPAIAQALEDTDIDVRISAMGVLGEVGDAGGDYVQLIGSKLQHPNSQERAAAARTIGGLRAEAFAFEVAQLLCDADASVRTAASHALSELGVEAAGKHVAKHLRQERTEVRFSVSQTLLAMSASHRKGREDALESLQPFIEPALLDKSADIRLAAMELLEGMGLRGEDGNMPACFIIAQALSTDDSSLETRLDAIRRLGKMGTDAAPYAGQLGSLLGDEKEQVRQATVESLRKLGEYATGAVPVAADLLRNPMQSVRRAAVATLDPAVLGAAAVPHQAQRQVALLSDESAQLRCNAVERLTEMYAADGLEASEVEAVLRLAATDKHWRLRLAVANTLDRLSMELLQANMVSVSMLCVDDDWRVRRKAKEVNHKFEVSGMKDLHSRTAKRNSLPAVKEIENPFSQRTARRNSFVEQTETLSLTGELLPLP